MTRLPLSRAAAAMLRQLLERAGEERDRILLTEIRSVDWQSLTFNGERHELSFRIAGPGAEQLLDRLTADLDDAEFALPGHVLADIAVDGEPVPGPDGSILVQFEALTIEQ